MQYEAQMNMTDMSFRDWKYLLYPWPWEAPSWQQRKLSGRQHMEGVASIGLKLKMLPFNQTLFPSSARHRWNVFNFNPCKSCHL